MGSVKFAFHENMRKQCALKCQELQELQEGHCCEKMEENVGFELQIRVWD
jgi:hypothetical protein